MTLARGEKAYLPEAKGVELKKCETIEVTFTAPEVPGENKPAGPEAPGTGVEFPALLAVLFLASAAAVVISKKRAHN
jgi:hypothetical protein